ncbi:376_t:CDS:2, partial [Racocetra persica]
ESQNLCWKIISPSNYAPSGRTGHIACAYKNKIYIFGGTDGIRCYNDMWCYDTQNNSWSEISSMDFNPFPRCYHKAALVDDIIYIFGGITNDNKELSDLTAFRINQNIWHIFQKMGPTPSPCYGHTMTAADDKVFIFGGESLDSKGIIHILDTCKPGGPKRQVKSPLEKVTESLPEIEEDQAIDEKLNSIEISTDNAK